MNRMVRDCATYTSEYVVRWTVLGKVMIALYDRREEELRTIYGDRLVKMHHFISTSIPYDWLQEVLLVGLALKVFRPLSASMFEMILQQSPKYLNDSRSPNTSSIPNLQKHQFLDKKSLNIHLLEIFNVGFRPLAVFQSNGLIKKTCSKLMGSFVIVWEEGKNVTFARSSILHVTTRRQALSLKNMSKPTNCSFQHLSYLYLKHLYGNFKKTCFTTQYSTILRVCFCCFS